MSMFPSFTFTHRTQAAHFRQEQRNQQYNQQRSYTSSRYRDDRAEKLRHQARFKTAQLIGGSGKDMVNGGYAPSQSIRCTYKHKGAANDNTDIIQAAQQEKHQQR